MGLGGANISGKTSLRSRLLGDACGIATLAALLGPGVLHAQSLPTGAQIVAPKSMMAWVYVAAFRFGRSDSE